MKKIILLLVAIMMPAFIFASEADLKIPVLSENQNHVLLFGGEVTVMILDAVSLQLPYMAIKFTVYVPKELNV